MNDEQRRPAGETPHATDATAGAVTTRFKPGQSGNPSGRKPGAELVRQLLEPKRAELVQKAVAMALAGDSTALRICMDRLAPAMRAESEPVHIPGLKDALTLTDKANTIINAMEHGHIAPEQVATLLQAISSMCKIAEFEELRAEVERLKQTVGKHR